MRNKKGMVTLWVIVAIIIVAGILIYVNVGNKDVDSDDGNSAGGGAGTGSSGGSFGQTQLFDVIITDNGFSPQALTVPAGSLVRFINQRSVAVWVASDVHPTHKVYPGSDISKCNTGVQIFDACGEFNQGDIYSFVFNNVGSWNYHDHLHPSMKGTIIVQG